MSQITNAEALGIYLSGDRSWVLPTLFPREGAIRFDTNCRRYEKRVAGAWVLVPLPRSAKSSVAPARTFGEVQEALMDRHMGCSCKRGKR